MLSPTAEYLNRHEPKKLGAPVDAHSDGNPMAGCYATHLKGSKSDKSVIVVGGGEVYQKMIGPALKHLGVKVHLFDPSPDVEMRYGETRIQNLEDAPRDIPAFILSPNKHHARQARLFIERGQPIAVEKPVCLAEETEALQKIVDNVKVPTYWIDFNHMMGRGLIALAGGVKMPFMDEAAIQIGSDATGKMSEAIHSGTPLVPEKVVKVTGRYFQAGNAPGGSIDHRQLGLADGGGMMRDLMTRLFNMTQLIGLNHAEINNVDLRIANKEQHGEYTPIASANQTEHYAATQGVMHNSAGEVAYDFAVGKYAAKNNLHLTLEYDTGDKLVLEWLPPNRKNRVTWYDAEGAVKGQLSTRVDPYMLIALDVFSHLEGKDTYPLYFAEQLNSVATLGKASEKARAGLPVTRRPGE